MGSEIGVALIIDNESNGKIQRFDISLLQTSLDSRGKPIKSIRIHQSTIKNNVCHNQSYFISYFFSFLFFFKSVLKQKVNQIILYYVLEYLLQ